MTVGMVLTGVSFIFIGLFQHQLDAGNQISVAWQTIPYLILTSAEIMVSIPGLEFAYTQAPRAMKSTIMSLWLLTASLGHLLAARISHYAGGFKTANNLTDMHEFYGYAALMLVFSGVFVIIAKTYKMRNYIEPESAAQVHPA